MIRSTAMRRVAAAAAITLAAVGVAVGIEVPHASAQATGGVQLAVPAYFTDKALWDKLVNTSAVKYVIAHPLPPEAGKSYTADAALTANIAAAKAKGKTVLVYVTGGYDQQTWQVVVDKIGTVLGAYPSADGVFIDEINYNQCDKYKALSAGDATTKGVRSRFPGKMIVLNPGAPLLNCYEGTADGYLNLERPQADVQAWIDNVNLPGNVPYYSWMFKSSIRPQMWQMIHGVKTADVVAQLDAAIARNAGVVFITDDLLPNPYDQLPTDPAWNALTAKVNAYNAGTATMPTPSTLKGMTATAAAAPASTMKIAVTTKKTVKKTTKKTVKRR